MAQEQPEVAEYYRVLLWTIGSLGAAAKRHFLV